VPRSSSPPGRRFNLDQYRRTWYILRQNTLALVGIGILVALVAIAVYGLTQATPWWALTNYCATNQANGGPSNCIPGIPTVCTYPAGSVPPGPNCYPTPAGDPSIIAPTLSLHPLSTGPLPLGSLTLEPGIPAFFDIYTGIVRGADWSLMLSTVIVVSGALVGLFLGGVAGYFGGVVDEVIMRIVDVFLVIPGLLLIIVFVAALRADVGTLFGLDRSATVMILLILGFLATWWPFYTRIVRGQALIVREQKYVEAARASGASSGRIILRHILPSSMFPVWIQVSLDVGTVPLTIAAINFLGFQILPSQYFPEWGALTSLSVIPVTAFLDGCQVGACIVPWWQLLFPGLVVFLFAISVNFLADGLRDALDPRLRR
jgi:peptide/nickel transport system permease protein